MARKISFIVLSNSGTTVKQFAVPVALLVALTVVISFAAAGMGLFFHDYRVLRKSLAGSHQLTQTIDE